ncbi:hypothetical protein HII36_32775 [Nonomuraea sp. NN258]|uniref:hypothetical protein n=1 Tax=Nonomuraea antri TaxID=2730852 RepID=UPI0015687B09|nr:hypothetical protein [Nonomuraea antri]NRQ36573.1 hypothetical protein [Nonomuraea antri]
MSVRALIAAAALATAAVAVPPFAAQVTGASDPANVNVQAIVDRVNLFLLTS